MTAIKFAICSLLFFSTTGLAQVTFEDWETEVQAKATALQSEATNPIEQAPEGFQYTVDALAKIAAVEMAAQDAVDAANLVVTEIYEPIPPPVNQVFSYKPEQGVFNDPLLVDTVTHSPGSYGEIIVAVNKAELLEIPGIDLSLYPGLNLIGKYVNQDAVAIVVYSWDMNAVELPSTVVFEINRNAKQGLEAIAVCRSSDNGAWTLLDFQEDYHRDVDIPSFVSGTIQGFITVKDGQVIPSIPVGWTVTADIEIREPRPHGQPDEDLLHMLLIEKTLAEPEPGFTIEFSKNGTPVQSRHFVSTFFGRD